MRRCAAFAIGVLRDIYAFHRYTTHSAHFVPTLARQFRRLRGVWPPGFTAALRVPLRTPLTQKIRITVGFSPLLMLVARM